MALTALAAHALAPATRLADTRERFDLAAAIPTQFAGWSIDRAMAPIAPNPESAAALARIYDQTLARTYVDANGQHVMLSMAYGGDQSKALQLHLPEICYAAQGFQIIEKNEDTLATRFGRLPVRRLVARADTRNEPITYWITVGDQATRAGLAQKLQMLAYGLSGKVPDGMLVRISTIERDAPAAYRVHDGFASAMLAALTPQARSRLLGTRVTVAGAPMRAASAARSAGPVAAATVLAPTR